MTDNKNMIPLEEDFLDAVSGGTTAQGGVMICTANAPLYSGNPAGNLYRSTTPAEGTVPAGTQVKLFERGAQYSKIIANGKIGWIETALLADK